MNLANKLTLFRVILVPVFLVFMGVEAIPLRYLWALAVFGIASLTDMLDGKVARKYNMITDFGKFLDPLADKVLVAAALVCFVELGWTHAWVVAVILMREFAVSGVRLAAASSDKKLVIPANIWGKLKTAFTMAAIVAILLMAAVGQLLPPDMPGAQWLLAEAVIRDVLMYVACLLTVISGVIYMKDYWVFIDPKK